MRIEDLVKELSELRGVVSRIVRVGSVHEVKSGGKERKMRVKFAEGEGGGEPELSPWVHSSSDRGEHAEEEVYKKGQNVVCICPNGDVRQAHIMPGAENNKRGRPDHATDDSHTYQNKKLRTKKVGTAYDIWIDENDGSEGESAQGGGGQSQGGGQGQQGQKAKPKMKVRLDDKGGITARYGKDLRFSVNDKGVKMRAKDRFAVVTKEKLIISHPWEEGQDPMDNDDE